MGSHTRRNFIKVSGVSAGIALAGCLTNDGGGSSSDRPDIDFDPEELVPDEVGSVGPLGNDGVPTDEVALSDDQQAEIADGDFTVSVVYHFQGDDWSVVSRQGIEDRLDGLGITLDGVQNPEFDAATQSDILETLVAREDELDAIISLPVDVEANASAFQEVADSDIELGLMSNVPEGFSHGDDYAGMVTADNYSLGLIQGRLLTRLADGDSYGMIEDSNPFFVTEEREAGAMDAFDEDDDAEITATQSFTDAEDSFDLAQNMLTANPDLDGIWTPWAQPPGVDTASAVEEQDGDVTVTSIDLGEPQAENMASGGPIQGLAVGNPYLIGQTVVDLTAQALLGNDTPAYIAVGSNAVVHENLLDTYEEILQEEPPESVTEHFD